MSTFLRKLYFFTKLSSSILLLLIVIIFIYLFSRSYLNQKNFEKDTLISYEKLIEELKSNSNKVAEVISKVNKIENDLKLINEEINTESNQNIKNQIEKITKEIDIILKNQKINLVPKNNQNKNNKNIINQYIMNISYNIENGIYFTNLVKEMSLVIDSELAQKNVEQLLIVSNKNLLSYKDLKKDFENISNLYLKNYLLEKNNNKIIIKYLFKFFSLKPDSDLKGDDSVISILSLSSYYLQNHDVENAVDEVLKIKYHPEIFEKWAENASNFNKAQNLLVLIKDEVK